MGKSTRDTTLYKVWVHSVVGEEAHRLMSRSRRNALYEAWSNSEDGRGVQSLIEDRDILKALCGPRTPVSGATVVEIGHALVDPNGDLPLPQSEVDRISRALRRLEDRGSVISIPSEPPHRRYCVAENHGEVVKVIEDIRAEKFLAFIKDLAKGRKEARKQEKKLEAAGDVGSGVSDDPVSDARARVEALRKRFGSRF